MHGYSKKAHSSTRYVKRREAKDTEIEKKKRAQEAQRLRAREAKKNIDEGIWLGRHFDVENIEPHNGDIHVVISHCANNMTWFTDFTHGFNISSIHIISKCGIPVVDAPIGSTIEVLPNMGRNDHSYAHYITSILDTKMYESKSDEDNAIAVFLKDNIVVHQPGFEASTFDDLVRIARSSRGFSCLAISRRGINGHTERFYSAYHNTAFLRTFHMVEYPYAGFIPTNTSRTGFGSKFASLGHMWDSLNIETRDTVQVCYGGNFAASVSNIKKVYESTWNDMEEMLERGDNIEEGHYVERSWGPILSTPLTRQETEIVLAKANVVFTESCCYTGVLYLSQVAVKKKSAKITIIKKH